ncbi:MAG: pullulanase [Ignavibacteriae bacterium]|nr:pullulanase [Ignavibacteriota bacterium]
MTRSTLVCIALLTAGAAAFSQGTFSQQERLQGYRSGGDTVTFLFEESLYTQQLGGRSPKRVLLEGNMRSWNHDMSDSTWTLQREGSPGLWILRVTGSRRTLLVPGQEFKFRVDEGRWMDVPAAAPNANAGNLVFEAARMPRRLKAEILSPREIAVVLLEGKGNLPTDPGRYTLTTAHGAHIPIARAERRGETRVCLFPATPIDSSRVHFLEADDIPTRLLCSFDGWFRHLYSDKELGANYNSAADSTTFRIFSPRATAIRLYLYRERTDSQPYATIALARDSRGVWEATIAGNLEGTWYDYTVHGPDDPGNEFFEQLPVHITDPYARVSDDSFGRARVWPKTRPAKPLPGGIPRMEDLIAYEVHIEDFTLGLTGLPIEERGTLPGFVHSGLKNSHGAPIGIDHLAKLGINAVHLLPMQEYLHYPDPEWQEAFARDSFMVAQNVAASNYDWGYRTTHAFAIESRYRLRGTEPGSQNTQFRDLVQAFHDRGIAVIVDMVFNHTAERMDGREMAFNFRVLDRHYHYRTGNDLNFIGDYGTETKSEDRPMMQRWIIDQCAALIDEYGVDGFRIDLAGLTDEQTLRALRNRIGREKIVYGEPWIASSDPAFEANPDWDWYKEDAPITFFQDDCRNALCGPPDNPSDKTRDRGYAGGNGNRAAAKQAIANSFLHEDSPNEGINYLDIHDNWALADRFALTDWNGELGVDEAAYRIAAAMLLTSLGPVVLHGGSEFMRSKGSAPLVSLVKHTRTGPIYLHGKRDTYNLRRANMFQWENLGRSRAVGAACDYQAMNDYWSGLIALRRSAAGSVLRRGNAVPRGYIRWYEPADPKQLGYIVGDSIMVLVNTGATRANFDVPLLPTGQWLLVADGDQAGTEPIGGKVDSRITGGRPARLNVPPYSVRIWRVE